MASIIAQNCYSAAPLAGALVETLLGHYYSVIIVPHPSQVR